MLRLHINCYVNYCGDDCELCEIYGKSIIDLTQSKEKLWQHVNSNSHRLIKKESFLERSKQINL